MVASGIVSSLVVDCADPARLAGFWQELLGGAALPFHAGDVVTLRAPGITIDFVRNPDPKTVKNRLHLDLVGVDGPDEAVAEALRLGATRADDVYEGPAFTVLRDPEGNEFCILRHDASEPWQPVQ